MSQRRPDRGLRWSLRAKLVLFSVALIAAPGGGFAVLAFSSARRAIENAVREQLVEVAGDAREAVADLLAAERGHLRTWAAGEVMRDLGVGDVDKRVARSLVALAASDPGYRAIVAADAGGRAVAASDPWRVGHDVAGEDWFQTALAGREVLIGPRGTPEPALEIAAPIPDPDDRARSLGVLLLVYDWRHVEERLERIRTNLAELGSDLAFAVVDGRGRVLGGAFGAGDEDLSGRDLSAEGWRSLGRAEESGAAPVVEEPRIRGLVAVESLDDAVAGWRLVAVWPARDAFEPIARMQRQWTLLLALILAGGVGAAALLAERAVRPLRALTEGIRELARPGAMTQAIEARSRDEIGELARAFNAMAADLARAQEDLVTAAKFTFAGEMAAGIAHEVRTPLGVLKTSAQILSRSLAADPPARRELVDMIVAEVDRLERVVAGLLELTRPREPVIDDVRLAPILARAAEFLAGSAAERAVAIVREGPAVVARGDPELLYQVVLNLVVNALQASPGGGTVRLRTLAGGERAGFEVEDEGGGIPESVRATLFTPFVTAREGGTGLGLAVVERIVRQHRGTIEVESAPGAGARFRVWLPGGASSATEET